MLQPRYLYHGREGCMHARFTCALRPRASVQQVPCIPSARDPMGLITHRTLEMKEEIGVFYSKRSYRAFLWVSSRTYIVFRIVSWNERCGQIETAIKYRWFDNCRIHKQCSSCCLAYEQCYLFLCQSSCTVSLPWFACWWLKMDRSMIRLCKNTFDHSNFWCFCCNSSHHTLYWLIFSSIDSLRDQLVFWPLAILLLEACLRLE